MREIGSDTHDGSTNQPSATALRDALGKFEHRLSEITKVPANKLGDFMVWPKTGSSSS
jgi:hypothetical protein